MLAHFLEKLDHSGQPFSLIMSDLDNFKQVNDTWGHAIGDRRLPSSQPFFRTSGGQATWSPGSVEKNLSSCCRV